MVVFDSNLVTVALPSIRTDLDLDYQGLRWVLAGYGLAFAGALLAAARAIDHLGARPLIVGGMSAFTLATAGCAMAPSAPALVGLRVAQGLSAAAVLPAALALIASTFEPGGPRRRVLGFYGAAGSSGFVGGILAGGILAAELGWRGALGAEAILCGALACLSTRALPRASRHSSGRVDIRAGICLIAGAPLVLYALSEVGSGSGGFARGATAFAVAGVLGSYAWRRDARSTRPFVPPGLRSDCRMRAACAAAFLTVGTGIGVMFVLTIYLQDMLGHDPARAGAILVVLGIAGIPAGLGMPIVIGCVGIGRALCGALVAQAVGVCLLLRVGANEGVAWVLAGLTVIGAGHFGATVAFTALAAEVTTDRDEGITMGLLGCSQQLGGAVGVTLLVGLAGAGSSVIEGLRWAFAGGVGLSLLAALVVGWLIR